MELRRLLDYSSNLWLCCTVVVPSHAGAYLFEADLTQADEHRTHLAAISVLLVAPGLYALLPCDGLPEANVECLAATWTVEWPDPDLAHLAPPSAHRVHNPLIIVRKNT